MGPRRALSLLRWLPSLPTGRWGLPWHQVGNKRRRRKVPAQRSLGRCRHSPGFPGDAEAASPARGGRGVECGSPRNLCKPHYGPCSPDAWEPHTAASPRLRSTPPTGRFCPLWAVGLGSQPHLKFSSARSPPFLSGLPFACKMLSRPRGAGRGFRSCARVGGARRACPGGLHSASQRAPAFAWLSCECARQGVPRGGGPTRGWGSPLTGTL